MRLKSVFTIIQASNREFPFIIRPGLIKSILCLRAIRSRRPEIDGCLERNYQPMEKIKPFELLN